MKSRSSRRLFLLLVAAVVAFLLWFNVSTIGRDFRLPSNVSVVAKPLATRIQCLINDDYAIDCLRSEESEVFVPFFSFLSHYFELYGKFKQTTSAGEKTQIFSWQHSYSKVIYPPETYSPSSVYLWFQNFNVEERERVKYVSGMHGVPVTSQWDAKGHLYPVQVCQFALSHFSKNISSPAPDRLVIEDGSFNQRIWRLSRSSQARVHSAEDNGQQVLFVDGRAVFAIDEQVSNTQRRLHLIASVKPLSSSNFSLTVVLQSLDPPKSFKVNYAAVDEGMYMQDSSVFYGLGTKSEWKHLVRSLVTDVAKARIFAATKSKSRPQWLRVSKIIIRGIALLDNVTLSSSAHEENFKRASDFLVDSQDAAGGWPVKVTRRLSNGELVLAPGWYSAMGQGQAMSVLTRMYRWSRDLKYLQAATKALNLFLTNSSAGGVRTYFADHIVWYEEYPTIPSSFVLNGFIYSLFGLYDLKMTCDLSSCEKAADLFDAGIRSLTSLLPLYDTGSGTLYDLRHFSLKGAPNIARWDYHTTHINQLLFLNTLIDSMQLQSTAKRWISYMKGKRAAHN